MRGGSKPTIRKIAKGGLLAEQGEPGDHIYLLLDGVLSVRVDGSQLGELGPGAIAGKRALLEDGRRTATLRAVTDCVIAAAAHQINRDALASRAEQHTGRPRTGEPGISPPAARVQTRHSPIAVACLPPQPSPASTGSQDSGSICSLSRILPLLWPATVAVKRQA
jgi:cyclic nucleotide-binding protein